MVDTGIANMYYFYSAGKKAAVNSFKYTLRIPINAKVLRDALECTVKRYYFFGLKPILNSDGKVCFIKNEESIEVYPDNQDVCILGTQQSNFYLFRVVYTKYSIRVIVFHGLADGKGVLSFCTSLLYNYLTMCGYKIDDEGKVLMNDTPFDDSELAQITNDAPRNISNNHNKIDKRNIFLIPEDNFLLNESKTKKWKIVYSIESLKKLTHKHNSSYVCALSVLFSKAIRTIYETKDSSIIASIPVDMRSILNKKALSNYCCFTSLEHNSDIAELPIATQFMYQNNKFKELQSFDNLCAMVDNTRTLEKTVFQLPIHEKCLFEESWNKKKESRKNHTTFCITNLGKNQMPKDIEEFVVDFDLDNPNLSSYPIICMISIGNIGHLYFTQNFENSTLVKKFCDILNQHGVEARLEDGGMIQTDAVFPYMFDSFQ